MELNDLSVPLSFEKQPASNVNLTAWLFNRDGQLIQQAPVSDNRAEFRDLGKVNSDELRLLIAPEITDQAITVKTIKRISA